MTFQDIIGHHSIKERLRKSILHKKILNSYVFEGEQGIGKKSMAQVFASAILCQSEDADVKPCGHCDACVKTFTGNHPDIIYVQKPKDKKTIGIDVIREQVLQQVYIKPLLADKKIFIIPEGEALTEQSQNGLLKVLEEPPSYTVFLILVPKAGMLLDTVLSRSGVFTFLPLSYEETKQYFTNRYSGENEKLEFAITFSQGIIGKGLSILENENFLQYYNQTIKRLTELLKSKSSITEFEQFCIDNKESIDLVVDFMLIWLRDCVLIKLSMQEKLICKDKLYDVKAFSDSVSKKALVRAMDHVIAFQSKLAQNVNYNAATLSMLMCIREEFDDKCSRNSI